MKETSSLWVVMIASSCIEKVRTSTATFSDIERVLYISMTHHYPLRDGGINVIIAIAHTANSQETRFEERTSNIARLSRRNALCDACQGPSMAAPVSMALFRCSFVKRHQLRLNWSEPVHDKEPSLAQGNSDDTVSRSDIAIVSATLQHFAPKSEFTRAGRYKQQATKTRDPLSETDRSGSALS